MNSADILVNQIKAAHDPAEAVPMLAEMFLRLDKKMAQDAEDNKRDHALILKALNGDPEDATLIEKAIHGRLRSIESNVSGMKVTLDIHERLLRGDPSNSEECGLVDNVQSAMRTVRTTHKIMWIMLGVLIPLVTAVIINLI